MKANHAHRSIGRRYLPSLRIPPFFRIRTSVPDEYKENFSRLYADIGWFGLLNGTALAFLTIYAARIGATADQIGLISAAPAIVILLLSLPTGTWLEKRPILPEVYRSAIFHRMFYLLYVFLPLIGNQVTQVWILIAITFLMNIPGTILSLGFNAMFAETVPIEWRGHVVGVRNAVFAVTSVLATLVSGFILDIVDFPHGYQIVFAIGFIGAVFSTYNLYRSRPVSGGEEKPPIPLGLPNPGGETVDVTLRRVKPWSRLLNRLRTSLHLEVLNGPFGKVLLLLCAFHLAQYLPIPVFPVYQVNVLGLTDQVLSLGTAIYNVAIFLGSIRLARIVARIGNQRATGIGLVLLASYPLLIGLAEGPGLYLVASFTGGIAWSLGGGALYNYLLEKVPAGSRATYLAWFGLGVNAAVLAGSLLGPMIAGVTGLIAALLIFAAIRVFAGYAILRWG